MWAAVANRRLKVVERLIEGGADINLGDARGVTPLIQAAVKDLADIVPISSCLPVCLPLCLVSLFYIYIHWGR